MPDGLMCFLQYFMNGSSAELDLFRPFALPARLKIATETSKIKSGALNCSGIWHCACQPVVWSSVPGTKTRQQQLKTQGHLSRQSVFMQWVFSLQRKNQHPKIPARRDAGYDVNLFAFSYFRIFGICCAFQSFLCQLFFFLFFHNSGFFVFVLCVFDFFLHFWCFFVIFLRFAVCWFFFEFAVSGWFWLVRKIEREKCFRLA